MKSLRRGKVSSNDSEGGNAPESVDELSLTAEKYWIGINQAARSHTDKVTH